MISTDVRGFWVNKLWVRPHKKECKRVYLILWKFQKIKKSKIIFFFIVVNCE